MRLTSSPTEEQLRAIDYEGGNLLILACAGSGKTETLARRIARMVKDGADRGSIVAFTFTDHAATELKHRIRQKLEENIPEEPSLGDMYVGTIHSYCLRVLREQDPLLSSLRSDGRDSASGTHSHQFRALRRFWLRNRTRPPAITDKIRNVWRDSANILEYTQYNTSTADKCRKIGDPVLAEIVTNYKKIAYESPNYFFDFNKIIDELIKFLQDYPDKLARIRKELTHVFVDEYQDVDGRQECLIRLLTNNGLGPHLTVVGDDDQALYGFRGAKVENILSFEDRYPDVERVTLGANFRSTHAIVSVADEAIRQITNRIVKEPVARTHKVRTDGSREERLACLGDIQLRTFGEEQEEAEWVADRIESLRGVAFEEKDNETRGLDYGDMAILLRSVRGSGAIFAETLRARGIPVVISGTGGLFNNDEVRLIQASFCLLARSEFALPNEDGRLQLLSTVEAREFVRQKIHALRKNGRLGEKANSTRFLSWIDQTRADLDQRALSKEERKPRKGARIYPQAIFHEMLQTLGAREDEWPEDVMFNFGAFSSVLTQFEAVHQWVTPARLKSLTLFLSNWAAQNIDEGGINEVSALNSVKIMTVHAAKGLEWPVVFLPRISSYIFPSSLRTRGPDTFLPESSFNPDVYVGGGRRREASMVRCANTMRKVLKYIFARSPSKKTDKLLPRY